MKRWLFILFMSAQLIASEEKPPTIKVLIGKLSHKVRLDVQGSFRLTPIDDTDEPLLFQKKGRHGPLIATEKGLKWREVFKDVFAMRLTPTSEKTLIQVNNQTYKGCLEIYSIGGTLNLVNEVDIENYLLCHLNDKSLEGLQPAALKAVAIAARTHLHYIAKRGKYANWQVELHKRGYPHPQKNKALADAIQKTRGTILTYRGNTFPTAWSSNSAGETISYTAMFRKAKNIAPRGVTHLPSHISHERTTWSLSMQPQRLVALLKLPDFSQVELFHAEGTRKVYGLRFIGEKSHKDINFFRFQQAIGANLLRSNDFTISLHGDRIIYTGFGEGIGVVLCLASAQSMAVAGQTKAKILNRHYPEAKLEKVDSKAIYVPSPPWK